MASKRYKFLLNTSSCFLCFEGTSNAGINDLSENVFSLQSIFHYLNMDLKKIETLSTRPAEILSRTDVRVNLCDSCGEISEDISNLYKSMEVIKMKLDYNFQLIQKKVRSSSESKNGKCQGNYKEMTSAENLTKIRHSKLMKELRQDILIKCDLKMPNYQPRVHLERARDFNMRTTSGLEETQKSTAIKVSSRVDSQLSSTTLQNDFLVCSSTVSHYNLTPELQSIKPDPLDDIHGNEDVWIDSEMEADTDHNFNVEKDVCINNPYLLNGSKDAVVSKKVAHTSSLATVPNQEREKEKNIVEKETPQIKSKKSLSKEFWKDPVTEMFCCSKCHKKFKGRSGLLYHYNSVHLHKQYKCKSCNRKWKYQSDFAKHKKTCQQNLEQRLAKEKDPKFKFVCEFCGKRWDTKKRLSKHRGRVHRNAERYSCDICDQKFTTNFSVKKHKDAVHYGKKFTCRFCSGMFRISHRRKHEKLCQQKMQVKMEIKPN